MADRNAGGEAALPLSPDSLARLFMEHRAHLRRMVEFRLDPLLRARVDPSDVLQEAFLNAQRQLPAEGGQALRVPPIVWLRQVTEHTLVDVQRRHLGAQLRDAQREVGPRAAAVGQTTATSLAAVLVSDLASPSQAALREERRALLQQALEQMDPVDREVLALRHFEELDNKQVAQVLGLQPSAASNRYVRALKRLKEIVAAIPALRPE